MAYEGQIAFIPFGAGGIYSDSPKSLIPASHLVDARNANLHWDVLEKDYGSRRWNQTALPAPIKDFIQIWFNSTTQRIYAICSDGSMHQFNGAFVQSVVTPEASAPSSLNVTEGTYMIVGGSELEGNNKKVFVFTGNNPVQVIDGNTTVRRNITSPPADWSGTSQPFGAVIYRNRLCAWGNDGDPHRMYVSLATDHEDFTTVPFNFSIYPDISERIISAVVFRGKLFVFKYPLGAFFLVDTDPDYENWYFQKLANDFGAISPYSSSEFLDDCAVATPFGTLTSLKAAFIFGDFVKSDIFHQSRAQRYFVNELSRDVLNLPRSVFYKKKQTLLVSWRSTSSVSADRIISLDYRNDQQAPKITISTKDNPNCMSIVRDDNKQEKPFYGANDGYLYEMDMEDRWVGSGDSVGTAYELDVWTPTYDFGQGNQLLAQQNKAFDHLELEFEPTGDWDLSVDVFIDGKFSKTMQYNMGGKSTLDEFTLDDTFLDDRTTFTLKKPLNGLGRRIAFRLYQAGAGQNVRCVAMRVYYRLSGQQAQI